MVMVVCGSDVMVVVVVVVMVVTVVVVVVVAAAGWRNSIHASYVSAGMRKRFWMRTRSHTSQSETRERCTVGRPW